MIVCVKRSTAQPSVSAKSKDVEDFMVQGQRAAHESPRRNRTKSNDQLRVNQH